MGTTMEQLKVTFIIAHHNYQEYLGSAIQSALNQTYQNTHLCIIDDCSQDQKSVMDIIRQYEEPTDSTQTQNLMIECGNKITTIYITDKNYGQAYARNRGMEQCWDHTDIFAILDADDVNYPTKIEKCVQPFLKHPNEIGAVYADTRIYNMDTGTHIDEYREPFDMYRLLQECIVHSGCLLSKTALSEVLENNLVFDEQMPPCEDYDLWIRISEKFMIEHIPEILSFVRVHSRNSTNTTTHRHRMSRLQLIHQKRQNRNNAVQSA
jgi:glycosyltransferase involved in cell wall biosynthesis